MGLFLLLILLLVVSIVINETFERFEDNFNQSSIGRAVSTVNDKNTNNSLSIQEAYLWDFSKYHMSSVDIQLFRVILINIFSFFFVILIRILKTFNISFTLLDYIHHVICCCF